MLAAEKVSDATNGNANDATTTTTNETINGSTNGKTNGKHAPVDPAIATQPTDLAAVPELAKAIAATADSVTAEDQAARYDLLLKARSLVQALETPRETMIKHCWAQTSATGALTFGIDTGLWELMARNGDRPQAVADLAAALGIDPPLLARVMRHVAAMGYLKETGVDEYQPTAFIKALTIEIISAGYFAAPSACGSAQLRFHDYAKKNGLKNPNDPKHTSCNHAYNTTSNFFEYQVELGYGMHFNHHMAGYRQGRLPWMHPSFYPVQDRLVTGFDPTTALLVDIGGSIGHDIAEFHQYHPTAPGQLILQDLPVVIDEIKPGALPAAITPMSYDFLTEQPIKGARAYYMHSVLHDWPDEVAGQILARIKAAMTPGYSRLLVNENVVPDSGAWWETTALDFMMMTLFCAKERTEADWRKLLEGNGFKIVKIWSGGKGVESLIECELP
ncbi:uncharacterized protein PgNI_03583 [Pyricularia grisea]|uniref:O-methyltransferase C-terminal domain-containing protein n=1 Tax=Pyricularia grisea TaxID=148305 RepID=A0A6P8B908_PYRGI|nr:uncharacterized protein PgNI_03583 [Pyricularia grisea]TLD12127.1 hypothetical protein PgNI_03583 [Pyricularia grisea]